MADLEDLQQRLAHAIANAVHDSEGEMVTKWAVLVETVDPDGVIGLWRIANPDARAWDIIGLLTYALHREQAATVREYIANPD